MIDQLQQMQLKLNHSSYQINILASLSLRAYLVPVFWVAANNKWNPLDSNSSLQNTINWLPILTGVWGCLFLS